MLLEGLAVVLITSIGIFISRKKKIERNFFRIDFEMTNGLKIPFSTQECRDIDFLQTQLYDIGRDIEKNNFFREESIRAISVVDCKSKREIFYVLLKKDFKIINGVCK